jgi:glycosyltransferase involved in cell wall biosynthesis
MFKKDHLNVYFINTLTSTSTFNRLFKNHNIIHSSAQKFFSLLAHGFASNPNVNVKVISLLPINSKDQKKLFWVFNKDVDGNIEFEYIPLFNIPVIRNILVNLYVFFTIIFKKFPKTSKNVILVDFLRFSINASVIVACKLRGIKVVTVVTDKPGLGIYKTFTGKIRDSFILWLIFDYYVCLTKDLNTVINTQRKPSLIIEGIVDIDLQSIENNIADKFENRVIVYAGGLDEKYGIQTLIEAFLLFPDLDLELWLFGTGSLLAEIFEYSRKDERIQYKGIVQNQQLMRLLNRATLLVNPRPTHEEFTKYSFPSKNIEYMSTGTPLLTTRLAGIPEDHYPYIYFIDEDSVEGVYKGIARILKYSLLEINTFGLMAKEYTIQNKNNVKQAEKIINMLEFNS